MRLKPSVESRLRKMMKKDKYDFFFRNMDTKNSVITNEIIDKLADLLVIELELNWDRIETVRLFLDMAACSKENSHD